MRSVSVDRGDPTRGPTIEPTRDERNYQKGRSDLGLATFLRVDPISYVFVDGMRKYALALTRRRIVATYLMLAKHERAKDLSETIMCMRQL